MAAGINIADQKIVAKDIDLNPYIDENADLVFESIIVNVNEVPVHLKEKGYYDGEIFGDNGDTGKYETHKFKGFKLESIENGTLVLIHPNFAFKYELEMYTEPKE